MEIASCQRYRYLILVLFLLMTEGARGRASRRDFRPRWRDNKDDTRTRTLHRNTTPHFSLTKSAILGIPRGGFNIATVTATATSAVLGLNGGLLLANPNAVLRRIYKLKPSRQSGEAQLSTVLMRSIGSVSIGAAITVYSSIVLQRSLEMAVAWGLIPRLLVFGWILAFYRRTPFLVLNTIMGCWCTFSLLTGVETAQKTWKVFSVVSMIKGLSLVLAPRAALQRFLGVSMIGKKPQALVKALGNEVATSALLMGSLAFGMNPIHAAGSVCLLWIALLADMAWIDKTWQLMDDRPKTQYIHMAIAALLALGFFSS